MTRCLVNFSVTMEEPGSDDKGTSESHHIQQKRPYSVFRECEAGSSVTYSDGPVYKKMKGADHGRTRNLTKHKAGEVSYDKGQHEVGFDGRNVKKAANHDGKWVDVSYFDFMLLYFLPKSREHTLAYSTVHAV